MYLTKVDDETYEVWLYCWTTLHDDYVAGHLIRDSSCTADSLEEWYYWHFEPNRDSMSPINARDLSSISDKIREMNMELGDDLT